MTDLHKARLVAALLGALTILMVLSDALFPSASPVGSGDGGGAPGTVKVAEAEVEGFDQGQFRRRNPFRFVRVHPPPAPPPTAPTRAPRSNLEPARAPKEKDLPVKLVGTIAAGPFGMAFLSRNGGGAQLALRPGADLGESLGDSFRGWVLREVERRSVTFRKGPRQKVLRLGDEAGEAEAAPTPPPAAPVPPSAPLQAGQVIRHNVDRSELDRARSNLAFLVTQLSVQPFFQRGRPAGVRVSRIRPGSFPARMGIRNGDILQGVNGKPIMNLKDTMALNQAFQGGTDVTVNVLRGGRSTQLVYQIR